jgi:1,4-alpha-glucan branching enzyme
VKFWLTEYHFDGFRFDGVTSMLYHDHGLGASFDSYDRYFSLNTNIEAVTYLQLATELAHSVRKHALLISEDMSGMPGMCLPVREGGVGFDYRLAMGVPDFWIQMTQDTPDEAWDIGKMWYELTTRRPQERNVGYCESHDQALVGDKTLMFRLADKEMYWHMDRAGENLLIDRAMALHKMIRLVTLSLAGEGYLNFMGNEFGHPEWIDFPREGNAWSYHHARRQWSLSEDPALRFAFLGDFDKAMLGLAKAHCLLEAPFARNLWQEEPRKLLAYEKAGLVFLFNFHPTHSLPNFFLPVVKAGRYRVLLDTDAPAFGGQGRIACDTVYEAVCRDGAQTGFTIYSPARTALVLGLVE